MYKRQEQLQANLRTYEEEQPLNSREMDVLLAIADEMVGKIGMVRMFALAGELTNPRMYGSIRRPYRNVWVRSSAALSLIHIFTIFPYSGIAAKVFALLRTKPGSFYKRLPGFAYNLFLRKWYLSCTAKSHSENTLVKSKNLDFLYGASV